MEKISPWDTDCMTLDPVRSLPSLNSILQISGSTLSISRNCQHGVGNPMSSKVYLVALGLLPSAEFYFYPADVKSLKTAFNKALKGGRSPSRKCQVKKYSWIEDNGGDFEKKRDLL